MKTLAEFTKTTLIGGVLIILPIYVAVLLLAKAVKGLLALLAPVTAQLPAGVEFRQIAAILLLVAVCFVVGLVVRTGPGLRAKNAFEQAVLEKLPGYTFVRGFAKTAGRPRRGADPATGAGRDRGRTGAGADRRGAGRRLVHGPRSVGADADGRQHLHPAARPGPSGRHPVHQGDRRVLEMGYRRRRVRAGDAAAAMPVPRRRHRKPEPHAARTPRREIVDDNDYEPCRSEAKL